MKILITGATGFVGTRLCEKLKSEHEVIALVRNQQRAAKKLSGVELVTWKNIHEGFELKHSQVDVVINLMGENIAGGRWTEDCVVFTNTQQKCSRGN